MASWLVVWLVGWLAGWVEGLFIDWVLCWLLITRRCAATHFDTGWGVPRLKPLGTSFRVVY